VHARDKAGEGRFHTRVFGPRVPSHFEYGFEAVVRRVSRRFMREAARFDGAALAAQCLGQSRERVFARIVSERDVSAGAQSACRIWGIWGI